ncbi:MAG: hypothetical protein ACYTBJ_24910, partial [Planctomycetota bacterium]
MKKLILLISFIISMSACKKSKCVFEGNPEKVIVYNNCNKTIEIFDLQGNFTFWINAGNCKEIPYKNCYNYLKKNCQNVETVCTEERCSVYEIQI